jgi:hypothetical protein
MLKQSKSRAPKAKSIELGALQDAYLNAKRTYELNMKALAKAQDTFDRSKETYRSSHEVLKAAAHNILA